jgi:DNA-binding MarR family transcriptional regulator
MTKADDRRTLAAGRAWKAMADLVLNNQRRTEVSERVSLSFGKVRALRRIAARPMPMRELAALLNMDPPNLSTLVDDLERAGLVTRQPHPTDRRIRVVVATAEGTALAHQADQVLDRPPAGLFELSIAELERLADTLAQVRQAELPDTDRGN